MEAERLIDIDLRNAKGEPVDAFDLKQLAKANAENAGVPARSSDAYVSIG